MQAFTSVVVAILSVYEFVLFIYILMSWFPLKGTGRQIYEALARLCEPYLALFRRFIPPAGNIDFSPMVAILILGVIITLIR